MKRAILIVWLVVTGGARGDIINGGPEIDAFRLEGGQGQTFAAADAQIQLVSVAIEASESPNILGGFVVTATIYEGVGILGNAVASTVQSAPTGRVGWVDFQFDNPADLTVGDAYTLWITSNQYFWLYNTFSDNYPGGYLIGPSFVPPESDRDLWFRILTAPLPGACCIGNGCLDGLNGETCLAAGGAYQGDGRFCDGNQGICSARTCCTDVGCFQLTEVECIARDDWQDWLQSTWCGLCVPPLGACCFTGLCLPDRTESECLSVSATWAGPLTTCDSCPPCEGPDFDGDGAEDNCDTDIDDDGVRNELDVCDFTPLGLDVQPNGTVPADLDGDCNVDLRDYALWQVSLTGP